MSDENKTTPSAELDLSFEGDARRASQGDGDDLEAIRAENTRLRQQNAELEGRNAKALTFAKAIQRLHKFDKSLAEKLLAGEELTPKQEKQMETEAAKAGVTVEKLEEMLEKHYDRVIRGVEERVYVAEGAKETRRSTEAWAKQHIGDHYDVLRDDPIWKRKLAVNIEDLAAGVEDNTYVVPKEYKGDVVKWAIAETWDYVKAKNPDIGREKKAASSQGDDAKAKKLASTRKASSASANADDEDLPEDQREEILAIRALGNNRTIGRSYANRGSRGGS